MRALLDHYRDMENASGQRGRQFIGVFTQTPLNGKYTWQVAWQQTIIDCHPDVVAITVDLNAKSLDLKMALPENAKKPKAMKPAEWNKILDKERKKLQYDAWKDISHNLEKQMELHHTDEQAS